MACTTRFFGRMVTGSGILTVVTPTDSITERRSIELYKEYTSTTLGTVCSV